MVIILVKILTKSLDLILISVFPMTYLFQVIWSQNLTWQLKNEKRNRKDTNNWTHQTLLRLFHASSIFCKALHFTITLGLVHSRLFQHWRFCARNISKSPGCRMREDAKKFASAQIWATMMAISTLFFYVLGKENIVGSKNAQHQAHHQHSLPSSG